MPACTHAVNVTAGPDGDGLMCICLSPQRWACQGSTKSAAGADCFWGSAHHLVLVLHFLLSFLLSQAQLESSASVLCRIGRRSGLIYAGVSSVV